MTERTRAWVKSVSMPKDSRARSRDTMRSAERSVAPEDRRKPRDPYGPPTKTEVRDLSKAAHAASERAEKEGTKDAHAAASRAHGDAASAARSVGHTALANEHGSKMMGHLEKTSAMAREERETARKSAKEAWVKSGGTDEQLKAASKAAKDASAHAKTANTEEAHDKAADAHARAAQVHAQAGDPHNMVGKHNDASVRHEDKAGSLGKSYDEKGRELPSARTENVGGGRGADDIPRDEQGRFASK